jgi:ATP-dependent RNA helicase SUPV3L1/SUV3
MIGNEERGAAWTNAILGLQSEVIHVCGEIRALSLVNKLCEFTNDELEERTYERYSKVYIEKTPFSLSKLEDGDCIITFSTRSVHKTKHVYLFLDFNHQGYQ